MGDGQFCAAHLKYSPGAYDILASENIKHLLMLRDPRDVAVSNFIYITYKDPNHRLHHYFRNVLKSDNERLAAAISGVPACNLDDGIESRGLISHYVDYLGWLNSVNGAHAVKFENLIGEAGQGSKHLQLQELNNIWRYLEIDLSQSELERVASGLFSSASRTFNRGAIGGWDRYFKDTHYELLNRDIESFGVDLGYDL